MGSEVKMMNRSFPFWICVLVALATLQIRAEGAGDAIAKPADDAIPVVFKLMTVDINVPHGGLYTAKVHLELSPTNDAAADRTAQQSIPYSAALEAVSVGEAYTLKQDGRRLTVPQSQIFDQLPRGNPGVPIYGDERQMVVIFPDVRAGDTLVLSYVKKAKAEIFPGQFMESEIFPHSIAWNDVRETITVPSDVPLQVETHGMDFHRQSSGSEALYTWHLSAPDPVVNDIAAVSPYDHEPRLFASTFKSYDELGRAFGDLAAPESAVTEKIKSLADHIVGKESDERVQAQEIYGWVSQHIRYVGIELGRGQVVPHNADSVLAAGYGDCKDHAVLYAALLHARGISSEMALINLGSSYTLSSPPTLAQLNHVITWIPDLKVYADTTAGVAPFGTLPFTEYGKPVVYAVSTGSALGTVPLLSPGAATVTLKTVSRMHADGRLTGESTTTATGPFAIALRQLGHVIEATGPQRSTELLLQRIGAAGTGSLQVQPTDDLGPSSTISGRFELEPRPDLEAGGAFAMPPGIRLLGYTGDLLMGPLFNRWLPSTQPTPCWSGTMIEELSLEPPRGTHFVKLPDDVTISTNNISFTAKWEKSGRTFRVRRVFSSRIDQPLCAGSVRAATAGALGRIAATYGVRISVAPE